MVARLFWWMAGGAVLVWIGVVGLLVVAALGWGRKSPSRPQERNLIIIGGTVVPTVVLTVLLIYGLRLLPGLVEPAPEGSLNVRVDGYQWWWRVTYPLPGGGSVELANEIRLPVNEPVRFDLESHDVIHAFWIPSIGGKVDMIPGRRTQLTLHPTKVGTYRGICAEYCGVSHALMALSVRVMEPAAFRAWLEAQRQPARPSALSGQEAFLANGCGACHSVRGTPARGRVGPDLTHVGSRISLGAALLPNDKPGFRRWLAETATLKPGVHMPHFGMLPDDELDGLAAYLESLQ